MAPLIVGSPGAEIGKLALIITAQPTVSIVSNDWSVLALGLATPMNDVNSFKKDLLLEKITLLDVVADLLTHWRSRFGENASVNKLQDILEHTCGWRDIADKIWQSTYMNISKRTSWNDLHPKTKSKIETIPTTFLGSTQTLAEHLNPLSNFQRTQFLENLSTAAISELVSVKDSFEIVCTQPQTIPSYYIPRKIVSANELNSQIYEQDTSDKFVVSGVTPTELLDLAGNSFIDKSSPLKNQYLSRFIRLVRIEDYEHIKTICKHEPVHHIKYDEGKHYWVQSQGNMSLIRDYLKSEVVILNEVEFVRKMQSDVRNEVAVIADCAGMGKSLFISSIHNALRSDKTAIVIYVNLRELANDCMKNFENPDTINCIVEHVTKSSVGRELLKTLLQDPSTKKHIFMDAFDEVDVNKQACLIEYLKSFKKKINAFMYLFTRVHTVRHLENAFQTLCLQLLPLARDEQIELITEYWKQHKKISNHTTLRTFATALISNLRCSESSYDESFAGIPLHCRILAEIYLKKASLNSPLTDFDCKLQGIALFELITLLVDSKMSGIGLSKKESLIMWHTVESIRLLFPDHYDSFVTLQNPTFYNEADEIVNQIGICLLNNGTSRFIHVLYAEYFIARWILEVATIKKCGLQMHLCERLLLGYVLRPVGTWETEKLKGPEMVDLYKLWKNHPSAESCRGKWETILHSMNVGVQQIQWTHAMWTAENDPTNNSLYTHNRDILFLILMQITNNFQQELSVTNLIHALKQCGFCDIADDLSKKYYKSDFAYGMIASQIDSGYRMYTAGETHEAKLLSPQIYVFHTDLFRCEDIQNILESCMRHDHVQLFNFLVTYFFPNLLTNNKELVDSVSWIDVIDQACRYSSIDLVVKLFQIAEEYSNTEELLTDLLNRNLLHKLALRGSFDIFAFMSQKLKPKRTHLQGFIYFCTYNTAAIKESDVEDRLEILKYLNRLHPKLIEERDSSKEHPMYVNNINLKLLQFLIEKGLDIKACDLNGYTYAHSAARFYSADTFHSFCELMITMGNKDLLSTPSKLTNCQVMPIETALEQSEVTEETITLLLRHNLIDVRKLSGMLLLAVVGRQSTKVLDALLKAGANLLTIYGQYSHSLLHTAAEYGNVDAIRYILSQPITININSRDKRNRTPLHWSFGKLNGNIHRTVEVLLEMEIDVFANDCEGHTALWHAENSKDLLVQERTIDLLRKQMSTPIITCGTQ